jgi:hypothetical protein
MPLIAAGILFVICPVVYWVYFKSGLSRFLFSTHAQAREEDSQEQVWKSSRHSRQTYRRSILQAQERDSAGSEDRGTSAGASESAAAASSGQRRSAKTVHYAEGQEADSVRVLNLKGRHKETKANKEYVALISELRRQLEEQKAVLARAAKQSKDEQKKQDQYEKEIANLRETISEHRQTLMDEGLERRGERTPSSRGRKTHHQVHG